MSCAMLPGLMVSESPVTASSPRGIAQKEPARRGKNRNSSTASGSAAAAYGRRADAPPRAPGTLGGDHGERRAAQPRLADIQRRARRLWRSRQAASSRNSPAPSSTSCRGGARVSRSFSAAISSSSVVPAASPLRVWKRATRQRSRPARRAARAASAPGSGTPRARGGEPPGDEIERRGRHPRRHAIDVQQHPAGERRRTPRRAALSALGMRSCAPAARSRAGASNTERERRQAAVAVLRVRAPAPASAPGSVSP